MKEKLNACFERLQTLDIMPTENNLLKLLQTLNDIREVYNELKAKEEEPDGGQTADPERRDGD